MLLLGSSLSHPGVGRMGGTSTAPHFAGITLAPLPCSEVLSRVSHCCVGRGWRPGPILGPCPLQSPPAWPAGACLCAQPSVNSSDSAGASSLAATLHDSGRRNPLSWLFPSELQPWHSPSLGLPWSRSLQGLVGIPARHWHSHKQGQRGEGALSPVRLPPHTFPIAEPPHCATTPGASPRSVWGNMGPFAGPHTEAGATCATCDTLCKARNLEGTWNTFP